MGRISLEAGLDHNSFGGAVSENIYLLWEIVILFAIKPKIFGMTLTEKGLTHTPTRTQKPK